MQTGSDLSLTYTIEGGGPQGPFAGTIDSATGAFSVPFPDTVGPFPSLVCTGNGLFGTAVPGPPPSLSGRWVSQFYKITPPVGCWDGGGSFTTRPDIGCACDRCEVCTSTGCELPIDDGCQPALAGRSSVTIRDGRVPAKDKLAWKWTSSAAVLPQDLGDRDYTLCVIDRDGGVPRLRLSRSVPVGETCQNGPCWTTIPAGDRYRNPTGAPDGLTAIVLRAGTAAGRGKVTVKGQGPLLGLSTLDLTAPVIVRLVRDDGPACWEATYSAPRESDAGTFKARSD